MEIDFIRTSSRPIEQQCLSFLSVRCILMHAAQVVDDLIMSNKKFLCHSVFPAPCMNVDQIIYVTKSRCNQWVVRSGDVKDTQAKVVATINSTLYPLSYSKATYRPNNLFNNPQIPVPVPAPFVDLEAEVPAPIKPSSTIFILFL